MNKQIWRTNRDFMILVNSTGSQLLSMMNGDKSLLSVIRETFSDTEGIFHKMSLSDLNKFNQASEFEDRFLTSSSFILSLWSRGFINLDVAVEAEKQLSAGSILKKFFDAHASVSSGHILHEIFEMHQGHSEKAMEMFFKTQTEISALLSHGAVHPVFNGIMEDYKNEDIVPDNLTPMYKIEYIKPAIAKKIEDQANPVTTKSPMIIYTGATIVITASADIVGDSVGRAESR